MVKGKPKAKNREEESAEAILAGVRKEMGRPRVAESAKKKRRNALTLPKLFPLIPLKLVEIKP
jgi:hypothetical protein